MSAIFGKAFVKQHEQEFGFTLPDRDIIVDDVRARGIGKTFEGLEKTVDQQLEEIKPKDLQKGEKQYDHSFIVTGFRFGAPGRAKREEFEARRDEEPAAIGFGSEA